MAGVSVFSEHLPFYLLLTLWFYYVIINVCQRIREYIRSLFLPIWGKSQNKNGSGFKVFGREGCKQPISVKSPSGTVPCGSRFSQA